ncbi:MAG: hypothetical protein ACAF41_19265 [Leptolyngbya sp. BL-A-14]
MVHKMNGHRLPVSLFTGMAIATIGLELPMVAVAQPAPVLVSQVVACVVIKKTAVYTSADPSDPEVQGRILTVDTPVALAVPLSTRPPVRVQIKPNGFVDYAALDCGNRESPISSPNATSCRKVRDTLNPIYVFRDPSWGAQPLGRVVANQSVYVTQTGGSTTTIQDSNDDTWIGIDLQRTFGRNFGLSPSTGWLYSTDPNDPQSSTLVYGCNEPAIR